MCQISVADPGCFIPDPGSGSDHCSIPDPDPGSRIRGVKKHRIPDPGSDFFFFTNFVYLSRIRIRPLLHPGSRIRGVKKHRIPDPGSGSATLCQIQIDYIRIRIRFWIEHIIRMRIRIRMHIRIHYG
jgi:hypothetical protein